MQTVILCEDILAPDTWERHDVEDVRDFLMSRFDSFPATARIYHGQVSQDRDVTPSDEAGIARLGTLDGVLYVVVYPGDPITIIVAVVAVAAAAAVAFLLMPKVPNSALRNTQSESPNNELSDRQNRPRPNGRIPDVFGTVRSTPDLLAVPYKVFEDNEEVEYAFMCVGRGEYDVPAAEVKDGDTRVQDIAGASVEVFGPGTSPNSGDTPQLRIGTAISEPVYRVSRSNAFNGQTLRAPNADSFAGSSDVRFAYPNKIQAKSGEDIDFTRYFASGDVLSVSSATFTGEVSGSGVSTTASAKFIDGGTVEFKSASTAAFDTGDVVTISGAFFTYNSGANAIDLSGTYVLSGKTSTTLILQTPENVNSDWNLLAGNFVDDETGFKSCGFDVPSSTTTLDLSGDFTVLSVSTGTIVLSSPSSVNSDWALLDGRTDWLSPVLETSGSKWIGPFVLDDVDRVFSNFVALNGLYKDDGERQRRFDVVVELELTPVDSSDTPIGAAETFQATVKGSETSRTTRAVTRRANPTFSGRCSVRARRVTDSDLDFEGTVVDEIKWRDLYSVLDVAQTDFGNVTTVHSVTYATAGALAVKDRKLNMLVTRRVPERVSGTTFGPAAATNRVDDIIAAICLDPFIGGRSLSELDLDSIYDTVAEAEEYFGSSDAVEFCYTFDNDNMSFEETVSAVASAVFCTAYRQGSVIRLKLERATEDSVLLFNHRNKLPGSETRTIRFGNQDDNDGVEYEWVDPEDDALVTFYLPQDQSATKPRKMQSVGVRNYLQAFQHAHRIWNKVRYQNVATDFEATQEAELLVLSDRILVADNTRPGTQDGQVEAQDGLELELSQEVEFEEGEEYVIFLQHLDGSVESLPVTQGTGPRLVVLGQAPRASLALDETYFAKATYQIVRRYDKRPNAFLLTERDTLDRMTCSIKAVNYDPAYYLEEGLAAWYTFDVDYRDDSGRRGALGAASGASIVTDGTRGRVHRGTDASHVLTPSPDLLGPASYTKAAWLYKADGSTTGHIMSSASGSAEAFYVSGATLRAGHDGVFGRVSHVISPTTWTHVAVTFDAADGTLSLYVDGELVDSADEDQRSLAALRVAGYNAGRAMIGRLDDVRLYGRALSATEVHSLWRRTVA